MSVRAVDRIGKFVDNVLEEDFPELIGDEDFKEYLAEELRQRLDIIGNAWWCHKLEKMLLDMKEYLREELKQHILDIASKYKGLSPSERAKQKKKKKSKLLAGGGDEEE